MNFSEIICKLNREEKKVAPNLPSFSPSKLFFPSVGEMLKRTEYRFGVPYRKCSMALALRHLLAGAIQSLMNNRYFASRRMSKNIKSQSAN